jgi:predicted DCC family thiol-disulfide oxidoreductase YuxK
VEANPILLFDGECGLCARSVRFLLARDRAGVIRFAPLGGPTGRALRAAHAAPAPDDTVLWFEPARRSLLRRSDAVLAALHHLGGAWRWLAALGAAVPRPIRDAAYDAVARRRTRYIAPACLLPTASERSRFLP